MPKNLPLNGSQIKSRNQPDSSVFEEYAMSRRIPSTHIKNFRKLPIKGFRLDYEGLEYRTIDQQVIKLGREEVGWYLRKFVCIDRNESGCKVEILQKWEGENENEYKTCYQYTTNGKSHTCCSLPVNCSLTSRQQQQQQQINDDLSLLVEILLQQPQLEVQVEEEDENNERFVGMLFLNEMPPPKMYDFDKHYLVEGHERRVEFWGQAINMEYDFVGEESLLSSCL